MSSLYHLDVRCRSSVDSLRLMKKCVEKMVNFNGGKNQQNKAGNDAQTQRFSLHEGEAGPK